MKSKKALWTLIFTILGALFFYLALRGQDWSLLSQHFARASWALVGLILLVSLVNHLVRSLRWKLTLQQAGEKVRLSTCFWALMAGYLVNLAAVRLGEVSRVGLLMQKDRASLAKASSSVLVERLADIFSLFCVVVLAYFSEYQLVNTFFKEQIFNPLYQKMLALASNRIALALAAVFLVAAVLGAVLLWRLAQKNAWAKKGKAFLVEFLQGIYALLSWSFLLKFVGYTCCIWLGYFFTTYLWFSMFPEMSHLGVSAGLVVMSVGSIAKMIPVPGNAAGAYHFLVVQALLLFAVPQEVALALAFLNHGMQIVFQLLLGTAAFLLLPMIKNLPKEEAHQEPVA